MSVASLDIALHIAPSLERTPCCVRRLLFGTAFRLSTVAASRPTTSASVPASVHGTIPHEVAAPISFYRTPALQESKTQNPQGRSTSTFDYACTDSDHLSLPDRQARLDPQSKMHTIGDNVYFINSARDCRGFLSFWTTV